MTVVWSAVEAALVASQLRKHASVEVDGHHEYPSAPVFGDDAPELLTCRSRYDGGRFDEGSDLQCAAEDTLGDFSDWYRVGAFQDVAEPVNQHGAQVGER